MFSFETGSSYVAQAGLEILLPEMTDFSYQVAWTMGWALMVGYVGP